MKYDWYQIHWTLMNDNIIMLRYYLIPIVLLYLYVFVYNNNATAVVFIDHSLTRNNY